MTVETTFPHENIAITMADQRVLIMKFYTLIFTDPNDASGTPREATDEAIQAEVDAIAPLYAVPIVSWQRIAEEDIPQSREHRNQWRSDGKKITVAAE